MAGRADVVGIAVVGGKGSVLRVVERGIEPTGGVVAVLAGRGEEQRLGRVPWIGCVVVVSLMAPDAGGRQGGVIAVDVAIAALPWRDGVQTGQRKSRVVVIEG